MTTDFDDPPGFSAAPAVTAARGWTPPPLDASRAGQQIAAYPDVKPILVDLETDEAFNAARDAAKALGWTIVEDERPGGAARPEGRIEAIAYTLALHIPVALSIRIRPGEEQTRVDMRVATRFLPNDMGTGAALIGKLDDALQAKDDEE